MRVIAGHHRSRKLQTVDDQRTRETKDRVKESIFNMLGPYQNMDQVLDLFAGSGSLGIEALSRGANKVVFVDQLSKAIKTIHANISSLGLGKQVEVYGEDAFAFLAKTQVRFDVIFLDPPYHSVDVKEILDLIHESSLLKKNGQIVILMDQSEQVFINDAFILVKEKRITRTKVVFLKATGNDVKRENK